MATCCPDGAVTNSTRTRSVLESQCVRLKKDSDWEFLVRVNRYGAFQSHRKKISWTAQREASSSARWSLASELPPVQMRMDGESSTTPRTHSLVLCFTLCLRAMPPNNSTTPLAHRHTRSSFAHAHGEQTTLLLFPKNVVIVASVLPQEHATRRGQPLSLTTTARFRV